MENLSGAVLYRIDHFVNMYVYERLASNAEKISDTAWKKTIYPITDISKN